MEKDTQLLRYTSISSYIVLLEDFPLPSISLLQKISSGATDALKCAQILKKKGKISENLCLLFNELSPQKCEKYFAGCIMLQTCQISKSYLSILIKTLLAFICCVSQEKYTFFMMLFISLETIRNSLLNHKKNHFRHLLLIDCLPVSRHRLCKLLTRECITLREQQRGQRSHCKISWKGT